MYTGNAPRWDQLCAVRREIERCMMYDVWTMKRTNIYVTDRQASLLRRIGESRGRPVAELVREAVDSWLKAQGVREIPPDEWQRRFRELLERRQRIAEDEGFTIEEVERDVMAAVREVRKGRGAPARRR